MKYLITQHTKVDCDYFEIVEADSKDEALAKFTRTPDNDNYCEERLTEVKTFKPKVRTQKYRDDVLGNPGLHNLSFELSDWRRCDKCGEWYPRSDYDNIGLPMFCAKCNKNCVESKD